jgi:hypothetical protein
VARAIGSEWASWVGDRTWEGVECVNNWTVLGAWSLWLGESASNATDHSWHIGVYWPVDGHPDDRLQQTTSVIRRTYRFRKNAMRLSNHCFDSKFRTLSWIFEIKIQVKHVKKNVHTSCCS